MLTIKHSSGWRPSGDVIRDDLIYAKGQEEIGEGGHRHYQCLIVYSKKVTLTKAKSYFPPCTHLEPTRSEAAEAYVWKEETRVAGSQFEFGKKALKRNSEEDWDKIWQYSKEGKIEDIPADIRIRCYNQVKRIEKDYMKPEARLDVEVRVYWGVPHSGKSHAAVEWLGEGYFDKPSMNKWWDGYQGETAVLIDDFDSQIGYTHLKRWFDRYKCSVETKGGAVPLKAVKFAITSNVDPRIWWPEADQVHKDAVIRRCTNITHFPMVWVPPIPDEGLFAFLNE